MWKVKVYLAEIWSFCNSQPTILIAECGMLKVKDWCNGNSEFLQPATRNPYCGMQNEKNKRLISRNFDFSTTHNLHQIKVYGQGWFCKESTVRKVKFLFNIIFEFPQWQSTLQNAECGIRKMKWFNKESGKEMTNDSLFWGLRWGN